LPSEEGEEGDFGGKQATVGRLPLKGEGFAARCSGGVLTVVGRDVFARKAEGGRLRRWAVEM